MTLRKIIDNVEKLLLMCVHLKDVEFDVFRQNHLIGGKQIVV